MKAVLEYDALVIKVVNKYMNFANLYNDELRYDLFQVGRLEVFRKIPDYDKTKSSEVTFFYMWIDQAIRHYLKHQQLVKLPHTDKLKLSETYRTSSRFEDAVDLEDTENPENILEGMQEAEKTVRSYLKTNPRVKTRPQYTRQAIAALVE